MIKEARQDYKRFTDYMRSKGWTDDDVKEYASNIAILFGKDESKALSIYPEGHYKSAIHAMEDAINYWKSV